MIKKFNIILLITLCISTLFSDLSAQEISKTTSSKEVVQEELNIKELILDHLADTYEWHLFTWNDKAITIHLPIILHSKKNGWYLFSSSKLEKEKSLYMDFHIATEGEYAGKIVERSDFDEDIRPLDLSLTKNAASLLISALLLIAIILSIANVYKKSTLGTHNGFTGAIEFIIINITDEIIKPSIGKGYKKYAPYLLTLFFFILFNNLLGLVPIFPGGANVTGNISVTLVLAVFTFLMVNLTGSKSYYKDLFWPDVPIWLKVPFPLMQIIELVGTITKPFALMIRLFANITAGHSILLGLTSVVFVTVSLGPAVNGSMSFISVLFNIFIFFLEILVAFIQAYIFTVLTSVFIGMARSPEDTEKKKSKIELNIKPNN